MHTKPNLTQLFQFAKGNLNQVLLDQANSKNIETLHDFLPQLNMVNYEFRLSQDDSRVDANIMVWRYEAPILLDWLADKKEPIYQQLRSWVSDWLDSTNSFHLMIQNIWIMYDLQEDEIPEPWIIFAFSEFSLDKEAYIGLIKRLAAYFDNNYTDNHWELLHKIYSQLSEGQSIPAVGFQNRNINSIRLGVRDFFDVNQLCTYLKKISWTGDYDFIKQHYADFITDSSYTMTSITFNEELLPVLGIECYMDTKNNLSHSKEFLNKLVKQNLCTHEKMEAIIAWIGNDESPPNYFTLDSLDDSHETEIKRWLLEVKLLVDSSKAPSAKAYVLINQSRKEIG